MSENVKQRRWCRSNRALAKYMNCSVMKIHRLDNDPEKEFPSAYDVDGLRMRDLNEIDEWIVGHRGKEANVSPHLAEARAKAFATIAKQRKRKRRASGRSATHSILARGETGDG